MLLYSSMLRVTPALTEDVFLQLVVRWNRESPYEENIIPALAKWDGSRNCRIGTDSLWIDFEEDAKDRIIAVRYEKRDNRGAVWDTDYVCNFAQHQLAIRLDRSYTEDALMNDTAFSTPHFVTLLLEGGYVEADNGLPVLRDPHIIREDNLSLLTDVVNRRTHYRLPVVYVSKTTLDTDPVDVGRLGSMLKGTAHILSEESWDLNKKIREACLDQNEYNGAIGIYFPNGNYRRIWYHVYPMSERITLERVAREVLLYANAQTFPLLYTWTGVNETILNERLRLQQKARLEAESARREAEETVVAYEDNFDDDLQRLKLRIEELTRENSSLQMENQGLRAKLSGEKKIPILYLGEEEEFYPGEIREMLLDAVAKDQPNARPDSRRFTVLQDILEHNDYEHLGEKREKEVKNLLSGYKSMSGTLRQALKELGFVITEEGKHYRLTYYGDDRYQTTLAKTGSDWREGKNAASFIISMMF
ncbi:MAG: hypothetical protein ACI4OJ_11500 [Lachnospiraceae bacterium]